MRSKWIRYSSSSASRSPCWPSSTSSRTRSGASGCAAASLPLGGIRSRMPRSRDAEPHPRLAEELSEVHDSAKRDDVLRVLGLHPDRAVLADSALELGSGIGAHEHAQGLTAVEADLDANELSHAKPPPRERRGQNRGERTQPPGRTGLRGARRRRAPRP